MGLGALGRCDVVLARLARSGVAVIEAVPGVYSRTQALQSKLGQKIQVGSEEREIVQCPAGFGHEPHRWTFGPDWRPSQCPGLPFAGKAA